jgi:hypothetical protein
VIAQRPSNRSANGSGPGLNRAKIRHFHSGAPNRVAPLPPPFGLRVSVGRSCPPHHPRGNPICRLS